MRRRSGPGVCPLPRARHRRESGVERVRGCAPHAGQLAPRGLGGCHRPTLDRDRFRRRFAPRRGGRAAARRPAGRRVIHRAALYFSTADDLTAAQVTVAHRPLGFRAILAAVRAGARAVYVPLVLRDTAIGAAVAASARARDAVVWLKDGDLPEPGPLLLVPATILIPVDVLCPLVDAAPGGAVAAPGATDAPALAIAEDVAEAVGSDLGAGRPLGAELGRLGLRPTIDARALAARDAAGRVE